MKIERYVNRDNYETGKRVAVKTGSILLKISRELYSFSKVFIKECINIYDAVSKELEGFGGGLLEEGGTEDEFERISEEEGKQRENKARIQTCGCDKCAFHKERNRSKR